MASSGMHGSRRDLNSSDLPAQGRGSRNDRPHEEPSQPARGRETALELLAGELAQMVAAELWPQLERRLADEAASPWLTTAQAVAYTGLPEGTFRKLAACGKIPSHGGRSKIFYRPEVDQALLSSAGLTEDTRQLRRVR